MRRGGGRSTHLCRRDAESDFNLVHHRMGKTGAAEGVKVVFDRLLQRCAIGLALVFEIDGLGFALVVEEQESVRAVDLVRSVELWHERMSTLPGSEGLGGLAREQGVPFHRQQCPGRLVAGLARTLGLILLDGYGRRLANRERLLPEGERANPLA